MKPVALKRMFRYDESGRKSHQLSIPRSRVDLVMLISYHGGRDIGLRFEISDWLKANCSDTYRVIESRYAVDVHFQSERDATLFWTFHA